MPIPVVTLTSVDPILQDAAIFSCLTDLPGTVVLRQELDPATETLRQVISDEKQVYSDRSLPLEQHCLGCALREDALPSLQKLAEERRFRRILLALPIGAESTPSTRPLGDPRVALDLGVELAGVVSTVDLDSVENDLLSTDLLSDRGLEMSGCDTRSVGQALAAQLLHADLVLTRGKNPAGHTLVDHVRGTAAERRDLFLLQVGTLFGARHNAIRAERRLDPRLISAPECVAANGVWTVSVESPLPLHPFRLRAAVDELGTMKVRSRGRFHLPSRLDTVGVWDGAGGQITIADAGSWQNSYSSTHLLFTGVGDGHQRARIKELFGHMLMTEAELAAETMSWATIDDGLDPWLGSRTSTH